MTRLLEPLLEDLRRQILRMASLAEAILDKAIRAVLERDATLAGEVRSDDLAIDRIDVAIDTAVLDLDDRIDELEARLITETIAEIEANPATATQRVDMILIAKNLERVADHATNIAEEVILAAEALNLKHASKLRA